MKVMTNFVKNVGSQEELDQLTAEVRQAGGTIIKITVYSPSNISVQIEIEKGKM